jgi:uroporphyrinogen decarboxylase
MEAHLLAFVERPDALREERLAAAAAAPAEFEMLLSHGVETVMLEEDFGCTTGPMMSPRCFREVILPGLTRLCGNLKSFGAPAFFHSCGVNRPLIDMFIDAGIDVYQAIQPEEDIVGLKRDFGDRLGLWGGISTDGLVRWTPGQMKADVARIIEGCKPGGGFILGASHSVTVRARAENYLAAISALNEHGRR